MERWAGRVAVVTGASAGIGAVIAKQLVLKGMKVVGLARRPELIEALASSLKDAPGKLYTVKADLAKEEGIMSAFKWIKENLGGVDVMVNNAALFPLAKLTEGATNVWKEMLDVNVLALSICTREAIQSMKERGVDDSYIFHINSVAGHFMLDIEGLCMYTACKHAVTALTEGLRRELNTLNSKIRITSISPGGVKTERVMEIEMAQDMPLLESEDIADVLLYCLKTPSRVQIHEIIVRPNGEKL